MAVLHRRVGLAPGPEDLPELERRLAGDRGSHSTTEEHELLHRLRPVWKGFAEETLGAPGGRFDVPAVHAEEKRERGRREAGLHNRMLVGEREIELRGDHLGEGEPAVAVRPSTAIPGGTARTAWRISVVVPERETTIISSHARGGGTSDPG